MKRKRAYQRYKPSSVEWLGDVPESWSVKRLKYLVAQNTAGIKIGPFGSAIKLEIMVNEDEGFAVFGQENVIANDFSLGKRFLPFQVKSDFAVYFVDPGDVLVTMMGTTGRCQIVPGCIRAGIIDSHLMRIRLNHDLICPSYFRWYFDEALCVKNYFNLLSNGSIMQGLNGTIVSNLTIPFPPLPEQQAIATFLDRETGRIDTLVAKKERLIELLREKRSALISHAVTKGIDPSVKLKPSGVEWLGDVPDHWKVMALKHIVATPVTDGPHETPEIYDDGIPFVSAEAIKNDQIDFTKTRGFISIEDHRKYSLKYKPQRNDIYIIKSGATTGNVAMVETDDEFNIWSPLAAIRPNLTVSFPRFLFHFVKSREFMTSIQLGWSFGTQQNIGMNVIENLYATLPPLPEQQAIAAFLDRETGKIDALIAKVEDAIAKLKEYRTALISAAVTGKIDVQEAA